MLLALATALVLAAGPQPSSTDRGRAEQLARSGKTVEAMEIFVRLVQRDPADVEARLWVARLETRLGRLADENAGSARCSASIPRTSTRASVWRPC